jgi:hypothetical protein
MKMTVTVSIVLNVLLLGGLALLWRHPRELASSAPVTPAITAQDERQIPSAPVVQTEIVPLRWSQFLSTNGYRAFVTNLRAAGCPEATVEDIVRGDTGRAYTMMREHLGVSAMEPGRWSGQAQAHMVAYFLGQSPNIEDSTGGGEGPTALAVADQNNQATVTQTGNSMLAAFLQNTDFTTPGMTTDQQQEIAGMRQGLLAQISGAGQAQNNQANGSTTSSSSTSASGSDDGASSQIGTDNTQTGSDNSQTTQSGTNDKRSPWHEPSPELLQAAEEESIVAGIFGTGAAMQYDQYQSAQGGK